jgi:YD repeat-containing protein
MSMPARRILIGLVGAVLVCATPAQAAPDDPYVVYAANREVAGPVILRAIPATGALSEVSRNGRQGHLFVHPYDLTVDRDGSLLVVDMGTFASRGGNSAHDGAVIRVDPVTGNQRLVSRGGALVDPAGIALGAAGSAYVVDNVGATGTPSVLRIDLSTGAQRVVSEGGSLCNPYGLAVEASGSLLVADYGSLLGTGGVPIVDCPVASGSLVRITPGGAQSVLSEGPLFGAPFGVTVEPGGRILVTNEQAVAAGITAVNPATGVQTAVTRNLATDPLRFPERVAIAPDGALLVTDFQLTDGNGGIVRVAPTGGGQRTLWQGRLFDNPLGIAAVVDRPPVASLRATPATAAAGEQVIFDASGSRDPEGRPLRYDWDLDGDRSYEARSNSPTVSRSYEASSRFWARVRVSDQHGVSDWTGQAVTVDATPPRLVRFRASSRRLLGRRARGRARASARARRAITFRYVLSERARVAVRIAQARPRRRVRGRCRPARRRVPAKRACVRWRRRATLRQLADAGRNRLRFSGRVRGRRLPPGRYRASAVGLDRVGNRSSPVLLRLRVVSAR